MICIKGVLGRTFTQNRSKGYTNAELRIRKISDPVSIVGYMPDAFKGDYLELFGRWILDDKTGDKFYFESYKNLTTGNNYLNHNEICKKFKNKKYSEKFITEYTVEGCKKIDKITLEGIVSNNNILIGYCDILIDYKDENDNIQILLIEVKSSSKVIESDVNKVLRQIKKYKFYLKKVTKIFLIYPGHNLSNEDI